MTYSVFRAHKVCLVVGSEFPMPAISTFVPFLTFGITVGTILVGGTFPPLLLVIGAEYDIDFYLHLADPYGILHLMGAVHNHTM